MNMGQRHASLPQSQAGAKRAWANHPPHRSLPQFAFVKLRINIEPALLRKCIGRAQKQMTVIILPMGCPALSQCLSTVT